MSLPTGSTLLRKLGAKPGHRLLLVNAPVGFRERLAAPEVAVREAEALAPGARADILLLWLRGGEDLDFLFARAEAAVQPGGAVWVVIPRKATPKGRVFPYDFAAVQEAGLRTALVDNKQLKLTEEEYGVRFVVRRERRADRGTALSERPRSPQ